MTTSARPSAPPARPLDLPARREFWGWVWSSVRPFVGWVLAALGAVALFLGWFGVSGQALTAKQLPYLVSGGLVGIALIVMAGVFLATEDWRRQMDRLEALERKVDDLHLLLTTDLPVTGVPTLPPPVPAAVGTAAPVAASTGEPAPSPVSVVGPIALALPTGTVFHRPGCALIAGKPAAARIDVAGIAARGLAPCRVCDPPAQTS